jgi:hypothetical protein
VLNAEVEDGTGRRLLVNPVHRFFQCRRLNRREAATLKRADQLAATARIRR